MKFEIPFGAIAFCTVNLISESSQAQSIIVEPASDEQFTAEIRERFSSLRPMVVVATQFEGDLKRPQVGDLVRIWNNGSPSSDMATIKTFSGHFSRHAGSKTQSLFYRPSTKKDFFLWIRNSELADERSAYVSTQTIMSKEFGEFTKYTKQAVFTNLSQNNSKDTKSLLNMAHPVPNGSSSDHIRPPATLVQTFDRGAFKWKAFADAGDEAEVAIRSETDSVVSVSFCTTIPHQSKQCWEPGSSLSRAKAGKFVTYDYVSPANGVKVEVEVRNYTPDIKRVLPFSVTPSVRSSMGGDNWQSRFGFLLDRTWLSIENYDGIDKFTLTRYSREADDTIAGYRQIEGGPETLDSRYSKAADGRVMRTGSDGSVAPVRFTADNYPQVVRSGNRQTFREVDGKLLITVDENYGPPDPAISFMREADPSSKMPIDATARAQIIRDGQTRMAAIEAKIARWGHLGRAVGTWVRYKNYPSVRDPDSTTQWKAFRAFKWTDPGVSMTITYIGAFGNIENIYGLTMTGDGIITSKDLATGEAWTYELMDDGWKYSTTTVQGGVIEQHLAADGKMLRMNEGPKNAGRVLFAEEAMDQNAVRLLIKEQGASYAELEAQWERQLAERAKQQRANERSAAFANAMGAFSDAIAQSSGTTGSTGIWDPNNSGTRALRETIARVNAEAAAKQQVERQAALDRYTQSARQRTQIVAASSASGTVPQVATRPSVPETTRVTNTPYNSQRTFTSTPGAFTATDAAAASPTTRPSSALPKKVEELPVEWKEGITLCKAPDGGKGSWRCEGPLQLTYAKIGETAGEGDLGNACGTSFDKMRDLGMVQGYRAFGCSYGIHPTDRVYPGNIDVPAKLGVGDIPGRLTYRCLSSKNAYCMNN